MNILNYKECTIQKGSGYAEYARLKYDEKETPGFYDIGFWIKYSPETKAVKIRRTEVIGTFRNEYYNDEIFEKLYSKVLLENSEDLSEIHRFYDKVHSFLKEDSIELAPIDIEDVRGDKVRYNLINYDSKYEFKVNVFLKKDGYTLSHLLVKNKQESLWVSIDTPDNYPAIVVARDKLVQGNEFRLKLLFAGEEM